MKFYHGTARNEFFSLGADGATVEAIAEIVIVTTGVQYEADLVQHMVRHSALESFRFCAGSDGLRSLAAYLVECADSLDQQTKRIKIEKASD